MKKDTQIKYGSLIKEEEFELIESAILPNTFVLESKNPFPGFYEYYDNLQKDVTPHYIYLVTDKKYNLETFTRVTQKIMDDTNKKYHAAIGTITIFNTVYNIIRVRRIEHYTDIKELQTSYISSGINFMHKPANFNYDRGITRLNKFFSLKEVEDGFYFDSVEANHGYFTITKNIPWREFDELTKQVRYNMDMLHFDASIGFIYINFRAVDIIRVYAENLDLETLKQIRSKYIERIK
ncbi:hypothetical protein [Ancylomarina sp. 16SWW S1-10-2]|uniref:hypothetical protein n=1 Tax=Ancylomarina sp. 16SWW S1-10-2 TaxID=2499681 RepID=UPI0012AD5F01|nr:hypothetical protein [Ancylomarina sp. 16SWW S1-10-2]MRT91844.1 hypothetical protein [Ancylomarina sp. 16SWW S1-10-2]